MELQDLNRQRLLIIVAAAAGLIFVFLPWLTVSVNLFGEGTSQSTNGFRGSGILVFLCFAVAAAVAFLGDRKDALEKKPWLIVLTAAALAMFFAFINLVSKPSDASGLGIVTTSSGMGVQMALISSAAMGFVALAFKKPGLNLQDSINELIKAFPTGTSSYKPANTVGNNEVSMLKEDGKITEDGYVKHNSNFMN